MEIQVLLHCFGIENSDDEDKVKAETKATLRCYVLDEEKTDKASK